MTFTAYSRATQPSEVFASAENGPSARPKVIEVDVEIKGEAGVLELDSKSSNVDTTPETDLTGVVWRNATIQPKAVGEFEATFKFVKGQLVGSVEVSVISKNPSDDPYSATHTLKCEQ